MSRLALQRSKHLFAIKDVQKELSPGEWPMVAQAILCPIREFGAREKPIKSAIWEYLFTNKLLLYNIIINSRIIVMNIPNSIII